jgi:hypothetical protein
VPLVAACTSDNEENASTATDLARAERVWSDPWAAPVELAVPTSGYGSNGLVVRFAGSRETAYTGGPLATALLETRAALDHGWELYAVRCSPREVTVQVVRGDSLDDAALATIQSSREPGTLWSTIEVTAAVPHHADGSWPVTDERLTLSDTCFLTAGSTGLVSLPSGPTDGDGEAGPEDFGGWRRDGLSDDEADLLDEVAADPWVRQVGATLDPPTLREGDSRRFGSFASGTLPAADREPRNAVAAVVGEMAGWEPTWASCVPTPAGSVDVRLRLVTEHGVATARIQQDPSLDGQVSWSIAVPVPEAPVPDRLAEVPALEDPACLGQGRLPTSLTVEGEPVAVPIRLQPVLG